MAGLEQNSWPAQRELVVGAHVLFTGLSSRAELNGTVGKLLSLVEPTGRWAVTIRDGGASIKVKPENLTEWPRGSDSVRLAGEPEQRANCWGQDRVVGKKGRLCGDSVNGTSTLHQVELLGVDRAGNEGSTAGWVRTKMLRPASPMTEAEDAELNAGCDFGGQCGRSDILVRCGGCGYSLCELHEFGRIECEQGDYCPSCEEFVCASCCVALNDAAYGESAEFKTTLGGDLDDSSDEGGPSVLSERLCCGKCGPSTGASGQWPELFRRYENDSDCS